MATNVQLFVQYVKKIRQMETTVRLKNVYHQFQLTLHKPRLPYVSIDHHFIITVQEIVEKCSFLKYSYMLYTTDALFETLSHIYHIWT